MSLHASRADADRAAERLKIYAQPQRLMILSRLAAGEHMVSEIDAATGIGQPALSQQLAELRRAEIVKTRRAAKQVYYRLADDQVLHCVQSIEAMFGAGPPAAPAPPASRPTPPPPPGAAVFAKIL
jgi:DNA-binding transcriptional ArsR family regulator